MVSNIREKRAQDEPKCEELRHENAAITAQLIATKDVQTSLLKDLATLKEERSTLNQRKVLSTFS